MKRISYLYENICNLNFIEKAFHEVCLNTKNKREVESFKEYKCIYISRIYNILKNEEYKVGPYNILQYMNPKSEEL